MKRYVSWIKVGILLSCLPIFCTAPVCDAFASSKTEILTKSAQAMPSISNTLTSFSKRNMSFKSPYGVVSLSDVGFTKKSIQLYLQSAGHKTAVYTANQKSFGLASGGSPKWIGALGYQLEGPYLLTQWGMAVDPYPSTGEQVSRINVVLDLSNRKVVASYPTSLQSMDYLTSHFLVRRYSVLPTEVTQQMNVINLQTATQFTVQFPSDNDGLGVFYKDRIYYKVTYSGKTRIVYVQVPQSWWQQKQMHSVRDLPNK